MARETTESEALIRFMDAMRSASGCAHQLAHMQQNPGFLKIRDLLEGVRTQAATMATRKSVPRLTVLESLAHMPAPVSRA
jgi:hypothetical protein